MIGAMRTPDDARWYRLSLWALVLLAWVVLVAWGASPFKGLLSHRSIGHTALAPVLQMIIFVVGWALMSVAMMLPSSLPLVNLFRRFVSHRQDRTGLVVNLLLGYLAVWVAFGAAAYRGDASLHRAVERMPALAAASTWIGVAILLIAGVYQVTPLKYMCLEKCRSPYSFLVEHWRGRQAGWDALRLGTRHGLFCVGCCWTLMLLMFAVGGVNLVWMLVLAAVMTLEKTTRWGRHLAAPIGLLLVLCAMGLVYRIPIALAVFGGD